MCMKRITPVKQDWIAFTKKRLAELNLSIAEAERQWGLPKDTIQKMLLGSGTDYEKFLVIKDRLRYDIPLYGKLIWGVGVQLLADSEDKLYVPLQEGVEYSPDLLAITVDDDRYESRYFKGDTLYFRKISGNITPNLYSKRPYIVKAKDKIPDIMIVRSGTKDRHYNLFAIDGSVNAILDTELEWCAPIISIATQY